MWSFQGQYIIIGKVIKIRGLKPGPDTRYLPLLVWALWQLDLYMSCICFTLIYLIIYFNIHICYINLQIYILIILLIDWFEREREGRRERERETSICCSTNLCINWLIPVCALTRDWTCNPGVSEQCSNQLSYPARAILKSFLYIIV